MRQANNPNQSDHGRFAAGLFAATFVMTGGGGICLMIALVFAQDIWTPIAIVLCGMGGLLVMLWLLVDRPAPPPRPRTSTPPRRSHRAITSSRSSPGTAAAADATSARTLRRAPRASAIREDSNVWSPSDRRVDEYRKTLDDAECLSDI